MSRLVFLVGEGRNDIGGLALEPAFQSDAPGFVQPVVRRILGSTTTFAGNKLSAFGKQRVKGLKSAISHKAHFAALLAWNRGAEVLVFVADVDKNAALTKGKAARDMTLVRDAISQGLDRAGVDVATVIGTPCRTIEAWALGDLAAVQSVAQLAKRPSIPAAPEELWGASHDPESNHPKHVLNRLCGGDVNSALLAAIAGEAQFATMRRTCPASFAPFAAALEAV